MKAKVDLTEFVSGFLAEADDLLSLASTSLLAAETSAKKGSANPRAVRDAYRALHTIKGLAAMVGVEPIVAIAHRMESALRAADLGGGAVAGATVDPLLAGVKAIQQRVRALAEAAPVPAAPEALLEALDALEAAVAHAEAPAATLLLEESLQAKLSRADRQQIFQGLAEGRFALHAEFTPSAQRAQGGLNITAVRDQVGKKAEIVKVLPLAVPASADAPGGLSFVLLLLSREPAEELQKQMAAVGLVVRPLAEAQPRRLLDEVDAPDDSAAASGMVRVEVSRLDDAMEHLSALIVTRFRLARAVTRAAENRADVRELNQIVAENARQLRDLRASVLHLRMVRVSEMLERVPLLVRGLRRNTGKAVRLEIDTGAAEVDKAVAERLFPAVVHLVRNAVDHGIESPEERRVKGKPEEGLLRIAFKERSNNQLELSVSDDGRGIDGAAVARKAGKEPPEGNAALLELLCAPGFSTREEASTTSGRGLGMDIARRIAVELGGEISLETQPGHGSTFTVLVPLTLTIVDALVFETASQRYAVPVASVEEIFEVDPARLTRTPSSRAQASLVQRRGEALPVLQLAAILKAEEHGGAGKALVIRRGDEAMGFAVQRMIGQQEVVIRPLEDPLVRVPGITGATDLGDGKPTLVLDLAALGAHALGKEAA